MSKKTLAIICLVAWSFVATVASLYLWRTKNPYSVEMTKACIKGLTISDKLTKNADAAYETFGTCVTNLAVCDEKTTISKLERLTNERNQLNNEILLLESELRDLKTK